MLEKLKIHTIHIVGGTHKVIHNTQTKIQNGLYLTTVYIAKNWDNNKNGHDNHPQDVEKSLQ